MNKMKIEIWSDIVCPFCYIGKRKFENALDQFAHKNEVQVEWKSFQLNPEMQTDKNKNIYQYLAERKGWSVEQSRNIHEQMARTAKEVGLNYNFDKAVPANTFNAHRLIHLAAKYDLQNEAEERLFSAYFTEGKNIDDKEILERLGIRIGLPEEEIRNILETDAYAYEVTMDEAEAQQLGVRGVPFFVIDSKYAVSGAQPSETFLKALQHAWKEYEKEKIISSVNTADGATCSKDGNC
jgi:predicted DsbA family dithiol-disulfide isomerase